MQRERLNGDRDDANWLCLADARSCRLLKATRTNTGRWHLDEIDTIENEWEDSKQHERPNELARLVERGTPSYADNGHQKEEERRRFARDAADWISKRLHRHEIASLHLFAAASMIGEIRAKADKKLWRRTTEHEADLNSIPQGKLVKHPAIRTALNGA
jgi:protein required for attachment to host cells